MAEHNGTHVVRGMLAGIAGGLVASWIMNVFMEEAGPKIIDAVASLQPDHGQSTQSQHQNQDDAPKEDATMKAADAIVSTATGGRHLSFEQKQKAGPVVHYAFGALMGGLYGGLAEYSPAARAGFGTVFAPITARTPRNDDQSAGFRAKSEVDSSQDFNSTAINSNGVLLKFSGACSQLSIYRTSPALPSISITRPSANRWRL